MAAEIEKKNGEQALRKLASDNEVRQQQQALEVERARFKVESASKIAELEDHETKNWVDDWMMETMQFDTAQAVLEAKRNATALALEREDDELAAEFARERMVGSQNAEMQARAKAEACLEIAEKAKGKLAEFEATANSARTEATRAAAKKDVVELEAMSVAAQSEIEQQKHREQLRAERKDLFQQEKAFRSSVGAFRAMIAEMRSGTMRVSDDGKLTMKDPKPFKKAPVWARKELIPLMREFVNLRQKLEDQFLTATDFISRISRFLKRDDLTVEAASKAQGLQDEGRENGF